MLLYILNIKIANINKKRQVTYIAPLQPPTLATFRSWGSSAGAGRIRLAAAKIGKKRYYQKLNEDRF